MRPSRASGPHALARGVPFALLALFLLTSTATAAPAVGPAARFGTITTITGSWANVTSAKCDVAKFPTPPAANATTGNADMGLSATTQRCGSASATGRAGFVVPFTVFRSGTHRVDVTWNLTWNASAKGWCCFAYYVSSIGTVRAAVHLAVVDLTAGTVTSGPGGSHQFLLLRAWKGFWASSNGSATVSLHLGVSMVAGHAYEIVTYVQAVALTKSYEVQRNPGITLRAIFHFARPDGGQLTAYLVH